jgi:hypothetical protein
MLLFMAFLCRNYSLDRFDVTGIIHSFYPFINNRSKSDIHTYSMMDVALFTKEEKNNQIIPGQKHHQKRYPAQIPIGFIA